MGGVYNIEIEQGSSFELEITYKDTNDAVIDLFGIYRRNADPGIIQFCDYIIIFDERFRDNTYQYFS